MTKANFPSNPIDQQTFTVGDNTYIFNSVKSAWKTVKIESFYLVQINAFVGPITGNVGYVPTATIELVSVEATLATNTATNITIRVRKNNDIIGEFTATGAALTFTGNFPTNTITVNDTVFLDIVSGSGSDLVVKFNYK